MCTSQRENNFQKSRKFTGNRFKSIKEANIHKKRNAGKLDGTGARPEIFPRKLIVRLAQQTGMPAASARISTELLYLKPYMTSVVHKLCDTDREVRLNFVKRQLHAVYDGEIDPSVVRTKRLPCGIRELSQYQVKTCTKSHVNHFVTSGTYISRWSRKG
jgi:hypothetical protein